MISTALTLLASPNPTTPRTLFMAPNGCIVDQAEYLRSLEG